MTTGARWRSLRSNRQAPTYIIIAAVAVGVAVLVVRHHVLNEDTLIFLGVFIPAVMCHEVSHGVVALWLGDDTAKRAGRLTLNPLKHIDPFGSIVLPVVLALVPPHVPFGWAKPVPVSVNRLRHPRNDSVLVSLAGPATNIIFAAIGGLALHEIYFHTSWGLAAQIVYEFGLVNVVLAAFNLIPIPPLDGSALVERLLPTSVLPSYYRLRMGFMVVVLLLVFLDESFLSRLLGDVETWYLNLVL